MALIPPPPPAAPAAFDLICTGTLTEAPTAPTLTTLHYRMSLPQKWWCWKACEKVLNIAAVNDAKIEVDTVIGKDAYQAEFNRYTGALTVRRNGNYNTPVGAFQCSRAAFSGFPSSGFRSQRF